MTKRAAIFYPAITWCCAASFLLSPLAARSDTSAPATTASSPAPVTINSCGPLIDKASSTSVAGISIPASTSNGIAIEFVNESPQAATLVNFRVESAGEQFVIRDVGSFAPGVSIKHKFRNGAGQAFILPQFITPRVKCSVASVKFADGSSWRKGQFSNQSQALPPAASGQSSALSATPTQLTIDSATNSELFLVESSASVAAFKETDNCAQVASIFVATTGDASATYSVKPMAPGTCSAQVTDEAGHTVSVAITVR